MTCRAKRPADPPPSLVVTSSPSLAIHSPSQMIGNVYNHTLEPQVSSPVHERHLYHQRRLVMKQALPGMRRHEFRQHDRRLLTIVMLFVRLIQEIEQRPHDGAIGRRQHHQRDIRPPLLPFCAHFASLPGSISMNRVVTSGEIDRAKFTASKTPRWTPEIGTTIRGRGNGRKSGGRPLSES